MKKCKGIGSLVGVSVMMSALPAFAGTVHATGAVVYAADGANGGAKAPIPGALVYLLDDELIGSTTLAKSYVNSAGMFDITVTADDGWFQGKLDPYILLELVSDAGKVVVESEFYGVNVACASPVKNETEGAINFGAVSCGGMNADGAAIFANVKKAYDKFTAATGQSTIPAHSGKAGVLFPAALASGVPYTTEESTHWPYGFRSFTKTAPHEFGHRIRHGQDGDFQHFLGDVSSYSYMQFHALDKTTNEGFAFNEGWAEYNAAQNATEAADELNAWKMMSSGANKIEGNVAAKLHTISKNCGGYKRMWTTLKNGPIHKYSEFADKLRADFNASATLRTSFPNCVSSIVATLDSPEPKETDVRLASAMDAMDVMHAAGANSPGKQGATLADVTAAITSFSDTVKDRASKVKTRNRMASNPKLKALGDGIASDRDAFEKRAAQKFETHIKAIKLHDGSKAATDQRRADAEAFMKDVFQDRVQVVEKAIKDIEAEKRKLGAGPEAAILDKLKAKADAQLVRLRKAAQSGKGEQDLLPRCFWAPLQP